jgi:hypothetical protein
MAKVEKLDRQLSHELDEIEQQMFLLKINYEKYFSGLEKVEPLRDRDKIKRRIADLHENPIRHPGLRFKFQQLKARFSSLELYWGRNLIMIERGTHPKFKFRADLSERRRRLRGAGAVAADAATRPEPMTAEQEEVLRRRQEQVEREERAYKLVYEKYLEARTQCGQSTDVSFEAVRDALRKQVRQIKATYNVESVKFRIVVEEGRAKVKAVPQQPAA